MRKYKKFDILYFMIAEVIISSNAKDLNRIFDYNIPESLIEDVHVGSKILVPFGTMKRAQEGFVIGIKEKSEYKVKDILSIEKRKFNRRKNDIKQAYGK